MDLRSAELAPPTARERSLRVLHAPVEIAGQSALSVRGLRQLGVSAHAFAAEHPFRYAAAPDIVPGPGRRAFLAASARALRAHDVVHYHYGASFLRGALDARALRRLGRRVVVEFLGSDVRVPSIERARNPHYVQLLGEDDAAAEQLMRRWARITDGHVILCDHSLEAYVRPWFEHVHIVGQRVAVDAIAPAPPSPEPHVPVVVHSPSDVAGKGTAHVRAAVETLRGEGARLEYVEVRGVEQSAAQELYRRADVVVDQLCSGSHGVFAAEAMAMAKPVVCYVLDELRPTYPEGFPLIDASPATVTDVLRQWTAPEAAAERRARGIASRAYAERVHDTAAVARRLLHVYGQLP